MIKKLQEKGIVKVIIFAVVLLIPIIYSFFYLKSYWDPYGHLSDITVGIVNLDKGKDDENRGKQFADELKNSGTFNFVDVGNQDEANKGLGEDEYYAVITIPSNFTETLNSASTENKQISTITYTPNKRKNYLASQILNSALKTVELNMESKISKEVTSTLADSLKDVPDNLQKIADGAEKIDDGALSLSDGLRTLSNGINTLDTKYTEFNNGVDSAYQGSESLSNGINQISNGISSLGTGANALDSATSQVYQGVEKLSEEGTNGIEKLTNGINQLNQGASSLNDGVSQYVNGTEAMAEGVNKYVAGTEALADGVNKYVNGTDALTSGISQYVDGAEQLASGTSSYISATSQLNANKNAVLRGIIQASSANPELAELAANAQAILTAEQNAGLETAASGLKAGADQLMAKQEGSNLTAGQMLKAGASQLTSPDETGYSAGQKLKAGVNALTSPDETGYSASQKLQAGANQLSGKDENGLSVGDKLKMGASSLSNGTTELKNGASSLFQITDGVDTLKNALEQIDNGTSSLANGVDALEAGAEKVSDGADTLSNGLKTLDDSSSAVKDALSKLNAGTITALDGSIQLQDGTETFKDEINNGVKTANEEIAKLDGLDKYVQDPVKIEEKSYGEVDSYGVAFAPLFISIGLWVGALMCYVVLYYDQRHRFGILDHDTKKNRIIQNAIYLVIGAVDGIVTGLLLKAGLGYSVESMGVYLAQCMLAGLVFMSVIQVLIRNFGDIGKFIALIILVLQLAASGGTFPVETIDNAFKGLTSWLPMTYTIRAFKDTLISTDHSLLANNTWILIGILAVTIAVGAIAEVIKMNLKSKKEV
ncbi:MAG: YhgE/Pip domain-containing protein [Clostridia bacterium]|nr:YhgE/Pip domain-containing protein [Clostridia bacterium]